MDVHPPISVRPLRQDPSLLRVNQLKDRTSNRPRSFVPRDSPTRSAFHGPRGTEPRSSSIECFDPHRGFWRRRCDVRDATVMGGRRGCWGDGAPWVGWPLTTGAVETVEVSPTDASRWSASVLLVWSRFGMSFFSPHNGFLQTCPLKGASSDQTPWLVLDFFRSTFLAARPEKSPSQASLQTVPDFMGGSQLRQEAPLHAVSPRGRRLRAGARTMN